jgi:hypothetical protein
MILLKCYNYIFIILLVLVQQPFPLEMEAKQCTVSQRQAW